MQTTDQTTDLDLAELEQEVAVDRAHRYAESLIAQVVIPELAGRRKWVDTGVLWRAIRGAVLYLRSEPGAVSLTLDTEALWADRGSLRSYPYGFRFLRVERDGTVCVVDHP